MTPLYVRIRETRDALYESWATCLEDHRFTLAGILRQEYELLAEPYYCSLFSGICEGTLSVLR